MYKNEVIEDLDSSTQDSIFYRRDIFDAVLKTLNNCEQQGYLILIEGIKQFLELTNRLLEYKFEGKDLRQTRISSIGSDMDVRCFQKMENYLGAKIRDVKGILEDEMTNKPIIDD